MIRCLWSFSYVEEQEYFIPLNYYFFHFDIRKEIAEKRFLFVFFFHETTCSESNLVQNFSVIQRMNNILHSFFTNAWLQQFIFEYFSSFVLQLYFASFCVILFIICLTFNIVNHQFIHIYIKFNRFTNITLTSKTI